MSKAARPLLHPLATAGLVFLFLYGSAASVAQPALALSHLRGMVLDPNGKPLAGAGVGIDVPRPLGALRQQYPQLPMRTVTDAFGRYDLAVPSALGRLNVVSRVPGNSTARSALVLLDTAAPEMPPLRMQRGITVQGVVLDAERRPLAGAIIVASSPHQYRFDTVGDTAQRVSARSGGDGRFTLAGLDDIEYVLRAQAAGHADWGGHYVKVAQLTGLQEIVLDEPQYVSGVVTDARGNPLAGATVQQFSADPALSTLTDVEGRFRIGPFSAGRQQSFDVTLAGYTPVPRALKVPESEARFVLLRNGVLRGRVLDAGTRAPLGRFQLSFKPHNQPVTHSDARPQSRSFVVEDGRFTLSDVYAGSWMVLVMAEGYQPTYVPIDIPAGQATPELLFSVQRAGTLRGRVIDQATGEPLAGAALSFKHVTPPGFNDADESWEYSELDGSFSLPGLPLGITNVRISLRGYRDLVRRVEAGEQSFVTFALGQGASVSGQVFASDGVTPASAQVDLVVPLDGGHFSYGVGTDANGNFVIEHENAGRYRILASTTGARSDSQDIVLTEDRPLSGIKLVLHELPIIRGAVMGLQAATRAFITAAPDNDLMRRADSQLRMMMYTHTARSDEHGSYRLEGLSPGEVMWITANAGATSIAKRTQVPASGELSVDFDFAAAPRLTGHITRNGRPAANVRVSIAPTDGQPASGFTSTSQAGEYSFHELVAGSYSVQVEHLEPTPISLDRAVIKDFVLPPHDLSGTVIDVANQQPLDGALQIHDSKGQLRDTTSPDQSGRFTFTALAAGDYVLTAYARGYDLVQQRITLTTSIAGLDIKLGKTDGVRLQLRSNAGIELYRLSIVTLDGGVRTGQLALLKRASGEFRLPPGLAGRAFQIVDDAHAPVTISNWNGAPLELELQRLDAQ
jgi:hypothetical protein